MLRKLHTVYCIFITGFSTAIFFPFTMLVMLLTCSRDGDMWIVSKVWSPILFKSGGASIEVIGKEHLDPRRPTIYVSNHQSTLDIPVLFWSLWPVPVRFVCKHTLKYVPVLGWYLMVANFIFINRSDRRTAVKTLDAAGARIRAGTSIIVFAEGTRSESGAILPFKKGPFALAVKAGVAICPVAIEGTGSVMPKNSWSINPGPVRVLIGAPIDPAPFGDDRDALAQVVREAIIAQSAQLGGKTQIAPARPAWP